MNTMNTTRNDTADHGREAIDQARAAYWKNVRAGLDLTITGPALIDPIADHQAEAELLPIGEATIHPDGTVEYTPAEKIDDVLGGLDYTQTPVGDRHRERIKDVAANVIVKGITAPKTVTFTGETVTDFVGNRIVHPAWCDDRTKCFAGLAFDQVEHASAPEDLDTDSFTAEAILEVITAHADYRDDIHRLERPQIHITRSGMKDPVTVTGTPEDLRALGRFILDQGERFQLALDRDLEVQS